MKRFIPALCLAIGIFLGSLIPATQGGTTSKGIYAGVYRAVILIDRKTGAQRVYQSKVGFDVYLEP